MGLLDSDFTIEPKMEISRRRWLGNWLAVGSGWAAASAANAHTGPGPVEPPLAAPALTLTDRNSRSVRLQELLRGHVTAVQLMFTGCSATCPIQGAVFASVQQHLRAPDSGFRLLSLSIDPLADDPKALSSWLRRFGASPHIWTAAVPLVSDVDRLIEFLGGRSKGIDRHTPQVYVFDRLANLAYRTMDLASPEQILDVMQQVRKRT